MASVYTVAQVNSYIKNMFTQDFALNHIFIKGEVSNCKYHTSGHIYFTLKDGAGTMAAVMFAGNRRTGLQFQMREGQQVIAEGSVNVYERDGKYQLYAKKIVLDGTGDLFRRFELLRNELEEMGMFAPEYKKPVPKYAKTVGIVTASTGAAIRDIINISARRNPYVQLYLYPALVQGEAAAPSIVRGIEALDRMGLDVIIVGRGGGSIEDLWAFNEEAVARAIFQCNTPIISAVGHETDVTIADYVADLRAPTPSAAAELAVFDYQAFESQLGNYSYTLERLMERKLEGYQSRLNQLHLRLKLKDPSYQMNQKRQHLMEIEDRMGALLQQKLVNRKHRLAMLGQRLDSLSPLQKLGRGYAFVTDKQEKKVDSIEKIEEGDTVALRFVDGTAWAQIVRRQKWNRITEN